MKYPEPKFQFKAGSAGSASKKHRIRILPVFSDEKPADIAKAIEIPALQKILDLHRSLGAFKGEALQSIHLAEHGVLLGGLGPRAGFHPETCAALFRQLGERTARYIGVQLEIVVSSALADAVTEYSARAEAPESLAIDFSAANASKKNGKKTGAKSKKSASKNDASDAEGDGRARLPDYVSEYSVEELISQMAACMQIGSDAMRVLRSEKPDPVAKKKTAKASAKKAKGPTETLVNSVGLKNDAVGEALKRGAAIGELVNRARYIASLPGNFLNPEQYESYARSIAKDYGLGIKVWNVPALEKLGCGGILAVGKGSEIPPRMIQVEYRPPKSKQATERPLVLVGKGITFDTGGISIKPSGEMHEMKFDMCGSALVLHAVALAAARKLPLAVTGIIAIAENMPDGRAIKPGDVYTAYNGLTVEVQNTDAEGRLVLGDALSYASEHFDPLCMMDFATLTGACIIALGHEAAAVMSPSEDLYARIQAASHKSLDRVWRLPHWSTYQGVLKSETSDIRNIGGRAAGTVTAMRFLSRFVGPEIPWAHVDIAGTAWRGKASGSQGRGATGWGIRLMNQFMEDLIRDAGK
ncbi:MAG: leucyl aminopeptidase [bacterium]|nr:leucyl aminopeptidase [bacterium]